MRTFDFVCIDRQIIGAQCLKCCMYDGTSRQNDFYFCITLLLFVG